MHEDNKNDPAPSGATPRPDAAREAARLRLADIVARAVRRLRRGGSLCVPMRGTFPQQFICAGTSDQIERLLRERAL